MHGDVYYFIQRGMAACVGKEKVGICQSFQGGPLDKKVWKKSSPEQRGQSGQMHRAAKLRVLFLFIFPQLQETQFGWDT